MRKQPVLEKHVVARIMKALRQQRGVVVRKRHGTAMGVAGDPDLYGSIRGRHSRSKSNARTIRDPPRLNSKCAGCRNGALPAPW